MPTIRGVWVFNENVSDAPPSGSKVYFTSNGTAYESMDSGIGMIEYFTEYDNWETTTQVHTGVAWVDDAYRTVDFGETEQEVAEDFYAWVTANAFAEITYEISASTIVEIANAIREDAGTEETYTPLEMPGGIHAVYEAGKAAGDGSYEEGYAAGEEVGREHGFTEGYGAGEAIGYEDGYTKGLGDGFVEGKQAEYDAFWDTYQSNGNRANYMRAFAETYWKDAIFKPKYPITCKATQSYHSTNATSTFHSADVTHIDVPITIDGTAIGGIKADGFFNNADQLETITLLTLNGVNGFPNTFLSCKKLKNTTIGGSIDVNISFSDSSLLTDASVQSIIDHLKDLTGATAQKLTLHNTVGGKLTDAQKAAITAKNWTLAY
jgi:hypothetical protein